MLMSIIDIHESVARWLDFCAGHHIKYLGPPQVKRWLLISSIFDAMIFWKCYKLNSNISENCWKFIASKMLELKSQHLTWGGPYTDLVFLKKILIGISGGTNSKISNFEHSNSGIFELRTQRTLAQKSMSNSNLDSRTSNFRKNKMT